MSPRSLHPAENRGYRELYVSARQLAEHWESLDGRLLPGDATAALQSGVSSARRLLEELGPITAEYGLYGHPAAQGLGARVGGARTELRDRSLERNQALRLAVLDIQHLTTLLLYLGAIAENRGDEGLDGFCRRWERSLRRIENLVRRGAAEAGADPDAAIQPLDASPVGRAAHRAAYAVGSLGEWIDRRRAAGSPD